MGPMSFRKGSIQGDPFVQMVHSNFNNFRKGSIQGLGSRLRRHGLSLRWCVIIFTDDSMRFAAILSGAQLLRIFEPHVHEVLFYYSDTYDELGKRLLHAFRSEASRSPELEKIVPKSGDIDGLQTSNLDLIRLIVKHQLILSRRGKAKIGYTAVLYPIEASPGVHVRDLDSTGSEAYFSCCDFVWNGMNSQFHSDEDLQQAQRLKCEHKKQYLYLRLLLTAETDPRRDLITKAHQFNRAFYRALYPTSRYPPYYQCGSCLIDAEPKH